MVLQILKIEERDTSFFCYNKSLDSLFFFSEEKNAACVNAVVAVLIK